MYQLDFLYIKSDMHTVVIQMSFNPGCAYILNLIWDLIWGGSHVLFPILNYGTIH